MSQKILKNQKIAIIGNGIAGLTISNKLAQQNEIIVFDKSRGFGGRMATRRSDLYNFDHGSQFFTAKSDKFKAFCQKLENEKVIAKWNCNFAEIVNNKINKKWKFNNKPHYVATPQMNNLCKYLGKNLNIILNKHIQSIHFDNKKWSLITSQKEVFNNFDYLILAIPSPQALNLIPEKFKYFDIIKNIKMSACFTLMLGFKKSLNLGFEAALVKQSNISWISVNSSKPARPKNFTLVINSSNKWADENIEKNLENVKIEMILALKKIINFNANNIDYSNIHLWKYANANLRHENKSLFDPNFNLGICGDWLISGRVENAFLSALDLYKNINSNESK